MSDSLISETDPFIRSFSCSLLIPSAKQASERMMGEKKSSEWGLTQLEGCRAMAGQKVSSLVLDYQ